ncbi:MAG: dTDP-4-dehydrorhamnose 3,5-epimerase, partial [Ignavibacteriaceae bacterium]
EKYEKGGITDKFVQDNISSSCQNTVRGLHFQIGEKAQGKLCQVIFGSVLDVAVDVRTISPTFGKYFSIELSDENHLQLWIPKGFAHGFLALSERAIFSYKCTEFYDKENERSILFNDPDLDINWGIESPIVSVKDLNASTFQQFKSQNL